MLFTEEHKEIRRTITNFVANEVNPHVDAWEEEGIFPAHEVFKKAGDLGLLGISKPVEFGGLGLDYSYSMVATEEWGQIHGGSIPMAIGVQTDMATPALARFGTDALRQEFLAPAISGDRVASIGVSEPHAGSDVAAIKTTARKKNGDYVINGTKMWITHSTQADYIVVLANTSDDQKHQNKSLIVVPTDTPGFSTSARLNKLGMRCSDTAQLFFDDVVVPQTNRIGEEGMGDDRERGRRLNEDVLAELRGASVTRIDVAPRPPSPRRKLAEADGAFFRRRSHRRGSASPWRLRPDARDPTNGLGERRLAPKRLYARAT